MGWLAYLIPFVGSVHGTAPGRHAIQAKAQESTKPQEKMILAMAALSLLTLWSSALLGRVEHMLQGSVFFSH